MSRSVLKEKAKNIAKEKAARKSKRTKAALWVVCAALLIAAGGITLFLVANRGVTETYRLGGQTLQLFPDGKFTARLAHDVISGTYTKAAETDGIAVTFVVNGAPVRGFIINNNIILPGEWDDGHGHGTILQKVN